MAKTECVIDKTRRKILCKKEDGTTSEMPFDQMPDLSKCKKMSNGKVKCDNDTVFTTM